MLENMLFLLFATVQKNNTSFQKCLTGKCSNLQHFCVMYQRDWGRGGRLELQEALGKMGWESGRWVRAAHRG